MIRFILSKIISSKNQRDFRKMQPMLERVNSLEEGVSRLSDEQLRAKKDEFSTRHQNGETIDDLLPEAFSVVREAAKRTLNMRHFDVQILGGIVLHQGKIAEMATGEGKTLVATLPVYLNSLTGKGCCVVTVNDYLAKRDSQWMGPIYNFLGLSVGFVQHDMLPPQRQEAYRCDVTYVTNNELGFDYLRDNMVVRKEDQVLENLNYAIIDEVDSILIDEARTPLIISGPAEESTQKYHVIDKLVPHLKGRFILEKDEIEAKQKGIDLAQGYDYLVDEKHHTVTPTEQGVTKCERMLNIENLYDDIQSEWVHHITQALRAHNLFRRDVDYVVKDGQVVIVDEFTGRLMPGRRWSEGLHQAIEAKENLKIAEENQTLATITFQNFFNLFERKAGMTGTAVTEADEFWKIYKLDVVVIPPNRPLERTSHPDVIYKTQKEKYNAILEEIKELFNQGRPVLVGTRSIENSEKLSSLLRKNGIPHNVLNAKYHEREAEIIAQAGSKGGVTIATNMAGRGTDIILGGNPPDQKEHEEVVNLGGLHILGTERHEARRIDNQLRGRAGRQGDPGSSRFYLALDDELMRLFGSDRIAFVMDRFGIDEGQDIQHPLITKAIGRAQGNVEQMNFDIRKQLLEYDNVMNKQREAIYKLRQQVLGGSDLKSDILVMVEDTIDEKLDLYAPPKVYPEQWNITAISEWMKRSFNIVLGLGGKELLGMKQGDLGQLLANKIKEIYDTREKEMGPEMMRYIERRVQLQIVDTRWKDHLYDLDQLRKGIGLRAYGQKDPLIEYQHESYNLFMRMNMRMKEEIIEYLFRIRLVRDGEGKDRKTLSRLSRTPISVGAQRREGPREPIRKMTKIGRNDPCPCGSGKKYKKCCGR